MNDLGLSVNKLIDSNDEKKILSLERLQGIRLFELFVVLDDLYKEGVVAAREIKQQLLSKAWSNQTRIIDAITPNCLNMPVYPKEKIIDLLNSLLLVCRMSSANPVVDIDLQDLQKEAMVLYSDFEKIAQAPFRDSTIKNMGVCVEEVSGYDNLKDPSVFKKLKEKIYAIIKTQPQLLVDAKIVDFDFSSCINLTTVHDDWISLYMHERTFSLQSKEIIMKKHDNDYGFVIALFVRYLRFGGRKFLYRYLCNDFHETRFFFDDESFYFRTFLEIVEVIYKPFKEDYPSIYKLFQYLSTAEKTDWGFNVIQNYIKITDRGDIGNRIPWMGMAPTNSTE